MYPNMPPRGWTGGHTGQVSQTAMGTSLPQQYPQQYPQQTQYSQHQQHAQHQYPQHQQQSAYARQQQYGLQQQQQYHHQQQQYQQQQQQQQYQQQYSQQQTPRPAIQQQIPQQSFPLSQTQQQFTQPQIQQQFPQHARQQQYPNQYQQQQQHYQQQHYQQQQQQQQQYQQQQKLAQYKHSYHPPNQQHYSSQQHIPPQQQPYQRAATKPHHLQPALPRGPHPNQRSPHPSPATAVGAPLYSAFASAVARAARGPPIPTRPQQSLPSRMSAERGMMHLHQPQQQRGASRRRVFTEADEDPPLPTEKIAPKRVRPPPVKTVLASSILCPPGRDTRPHKMCIILRGLPGSGKTHHAKIIKDIETSYGGSAPRIQCLDDYYMTEKDVMVYDETVGRKVKRKVLEYEFDSEMEPTYMQSALRSFQKTLDRNLFRFIIVDNINVRVVDFKTYWDLAKAKGFEVYVFELKASTKVCAKRNVHSWKKSSLERMWRDFEPTPAHMLRLKWDNPVDKTEASVQVTIEDVEMDADDAALTAEPEKPNRPKRKKSRYDSSSDEEDGQKRKRRKKKKKKKKKKKPKTDAPAAADQSPADAAPASALALLAGSYEVKRVTWADQTSDGEDSGMPLASYAPQPKNYKSALAASSWRGPGHVSTRQMFANSVKAGQFARKVKAELMEFRKNFPKLPRDEAADASS